MNNASKTNLLDDKRFQGNSPWFEGSGSARNQYGYGRKMVWMAGNTMATRALKQAPVRPGLSGRACLAAQRRCKPGTGRAMV